MMRVARWDSPDVPHIRCIGELGVGILESVLVPAAMAGYHGECSHHDQGVSASRTGGSGVGRGVVRPNCAGSLRQCGRGSHTEHGN